jgi:hypothetical protein
VVDGQASGTGIVQIFTSLLFFGVGFDSFFFGKGVPRTIFVICFFSEFCLFHLFILFFLLGWDLFSSQQMPNSPDGDTFCPSAELDRLHKSVVRNISGEYFFVDWPPNRTIDTQLLLS